MSTETHISQEQLVKDENKKTMVYFKVAVVLITILFAELVLINFSDTTGVVIGLIFGLLTIKFITLLVWFMHLRWEKLLCSWLFIIGLVLTAGTVAAIISIMLFADNLLGIE